MATATITNGFTQLHACDATSGVSGNSIAVDTAVYKENSASLSFTLTSSKRVIDVTTFINTASWSSGDCVRFWVNFALPSELATAANGGLKVELSDGTNTAFYEFLGSDNYGGGWVLGSIDIAGGTILSGTRPTGTLTSIGLELTVTGTLRNATNTWVDNFHIGTGYSVYGGTSGDKIGMDEILAADIAGGWGLVQENGGVYFLTGKLNMLDDSGTNATYFGDSGKPLTFTHIGSVPSTAFALTAYGNTTGVSDIVMAGFFILGDTNRVLIDFDDANLDNLSVFGTTYVNASTIDYKADSTHDIKSCIYVNCQQINPQTSTFQNNTISDYVGTTGAVLWPSDDTNISGLTFVNCDNDVEYASTSDSTPSFVNIVHDDTSGDYDVNNTSGAAKTIPISGTSNGNSYNPGGSAVTFQASVTLTFNVEDVAGSAIEDARINIVNSSTKVELYQIETNALGVATQSHSYSGELGIEGWCRQFDISGTDYRPKDWSGTITSNGFTITIVLEAYD